MSLPAFPGFIYKSLRQEKESLLINHRNRIWAFLPTYLARVGIGRASTKETCWAGRSQQRGLLDQFVELIWTVRGASRLDCFNTFAPSEGQYVAGICSSQLVLNRETKSTKNKLWHHWRSVSVLFLFSLPHLKCLRIKVLEFKGATETTYNIWN